MSEERVLAAVEALRDEQLAFLRALVRIPTINPPGQRYEECARFVGDALRRLGYGVEEVRPRAEDAAYPRVNVVGRLEGVEPRPTLHFNGHVDVVPAGEGWSHDPFAGEVSEGKIWGRGTGDQKAGIAASLFAVEAIRRAGARLRGSVEQSATVDEETGGSAGVAELCDRGHIARDRTDHVVITEPLGPDRVCLGHRGVYWFEVTARGETGHGSMPGFGRNAADAMVRFILRVDEELGPALASRRTAMPVEPPLARHPSINLTTIHAGQSLDGLQSAVVPDVCVAIFDRRFVLEEPVADVRAEIDGLLEAERKAAPGIRWSLRELMCVEPVMTDPGARVVREFAASVERIYGRAPALIASPGTYDQKHVVRRAGVTECIAYGPGILETAHRPNEYVGLDDLVNATKVMALATLRLVG